MKCTNHPHKDAVTKCSQCQDALCDECVLSGKDKDAVCSCCAILVAAKDASRVAYERREEREVKRQAMKAKGKRKIHTLLLVVISLAVAVLGANLYLHLKVNAPNIEEFDPYENLALTAGLVNEAITEYAEDHGGKFPKYLNDIPGKYMPSEKITSSVFKKFSYTRFSPKSYELRVRDSVGGIDLGLVFTEKDL